MGCACSCYADDANGAVGTGTSTQQRQRWQRKYQHLLATALVANAFSKHRTSDVAFRTIARLYAHEVSRPRQGC